MASYVNFCRVSSTPEELILDLGLNPQPMNPAVAKISVSQRTIMNHYTAKRLLAALSTALHAIRALLECWRRTSGGECAGSNVAALRRPYAV